MTKENLIKHIKDNTPQDHKGKYYALMLFKTELELGLSQEPNKWYNIANHVFTSGLDALNAYANIPNPASQLIDATSPEELADKMLEMVDNFNNLEWLQNELYPAL